MINKYRLYTLTASYLFMVAAPIRVISHYINAKQSLSLQYLAPLAFSLVIILSVGMMIRKGHLWLRWILLIGAIYNIYILLGHLPQYFKQPVLWQWLGGLQYLLQIGTILLMFIAKHYLSAAETEQQPTLSLDTDNIA